MMREPRVSSGSKLVHATHTASAAQSAMMYANVIARKIPAISSSGSGTPYSPSRAMKSEPRKVRNHPRIKYGLRCIPQMGTASESRP